MLAGFLIAGAVRRAEGRRMVRLRHRVELLGWFGGRMVRGAAAGAGLLPVAGLLQKAFGAKSPEALTRGVAMTGIALLLFAWLPVLLGMAARIASSGSAAGRAALPAILAESVPLGVGSLALAAVLSAELSSADAVLMMLATSGARDFYRGFLRPNATRRARAPRCAHPGRAPAASSALRSRSISTAWSSAIQLFYQVMIVTLFAPMLGALILPARRTLERADRDARRRRHARDDAARDRRRGSGMGVRRTSWACVASAIDVLHPGGVLSP